MKASKHVTITSKNQVTIPADFVKSLKLHQDRTMQATIKDGSVVLTPTRDLSDDMERFWIKRNPKAKLNNDQLKQASRQSAVRRLTSDTAR
jgi:antitoxin component of MazEF toxin-antitoxin module